MGPILDAIVKGIFDGIFPTMFLGGFQKNWSLVFF